MTGRQPAWTSLAELVPWLRGQAVHLAAADAEPVLVELLSAAGFTLARTTGTGTRYQPVAAALRLPPTAGTNLDALSDSLRDLPDRWPGVDRLALLVPDAQILVQSESAGLASAQPAAGPGDRSALAGPPAGLRDGVPRPGRLVRRRLPELRPTTYLPGAP